MKHFFRHITQLNLPTIILLSVGSICLWIPQFYASLLWKPALATVLLTLLNAYLFSIVNYQARITRSIFGLPFFLYIFVVATITPLHTDWQSQILVLLLQFILLLLLRTYRKESTAEESFLSTLMLCISSLILPDMLLFVPVLWFAFFIQGAMNLKAFLASLIALALAATYFFVTDFIGWTNTDIFVSKITRSPMPLISNLPSFVSLILLISSSVFALLCNINTYQQQRSIVTAYLTYIMVPMMLCFIMSFFPAQHAPSLLAVSAYFTASINAYFFSTQKTVFSGICFTILFLLLSVNYILSFLL